MHLTICSYHVTYVFQSEFTLYSCLNVKELLGQNRNNIWSLSDCNEVQTQNHLVGKQTLNHLAKRQIWIRIWVWKNSNFLLNLTEFPLKQDSSTTAPNLNKLSLIKNFTNYLKTKLWHVLSIKNMKWYSPIFLGKKTDGSISLILNLKKLNENTQIVHFTMETKMCI